MGASRIGCRNSNAFRHMVLLGHLISAQCTLNMTCPNYIKQPWKPKVASPPPIEMAIPTSIDQTLAPPGQHVVQFFVQYTPYHLANGQRWDDIKERYVDDVVFATIERYCPGFISSVVHRDVLSPLDLERIFNLHQGNIYHGSHRIDQIGFWRPMAGWGSHRSSVRGLYLCGAGCHPGGGVMGASGRNAATVVMRD